MINEALKTWGFSRREYQPETAYTTSLKGNVLKL